MHDGPDAALCEDTRQQNGIGDVPFIKRDSVRHGEGKAGRQVVDHGDIPAGIAQRKDGMASDITRAASNQYGSSCRIVHGFNA